MKRLITVIALFPSLLLADPTVMPADGNPRGISLPLNGYYRVGRYMPVQFSSSASELSICADGTVTTKIANPSGGVAPVFMSRTPMHDSLMFSQLHELAPDEMLVGTSANIGDISPGVFPEYKIQTIQLDAANPLPGPICAWQTLNAIILDQDEFAGLEQRNELRDLLAGGTTIAIPSNGAKPPDPTLPWRSAQRFWILDAPAPLISFGGDAAYESVANWNPGLPQQGRWQIIIMGFVFAILSLLITLWKSRWRAFAIVAFSFATVATASEWSGFLPANSQATGIICTDMTKDAWSFYRAIAPCQISKRFEGTMWPIIPERGSQQVVLQCKSDGVPESLSTTLSRGEMAISVSRGIFPNHDLLPNKTSITAAHETPLKAISRSAYPGWVVTGEIALGGDWPWLLLANSDPIPKNLMPPSTRDSSNK